MLWLITVIVNHLKQPGLTLPSLGLCYYFPELKTKVYLSHFRSFVAMEKFFSTAVITPYEQLRGQGMILRLFQPLVGPLY